MSISTLQPEIEYGDPLHPLSNAAIPMPSTRTSTNRRSAWALADEQPAPPGASPPRQKHRSLCDYCRLISRRSCNGHDSPTPEASFQTLTMGPTRRTPHAREETGISWLTSLSGPRTLTVITCIFSPAGLDAAANQTDALGTPRRV